MKVNYMNTYQSYTIAYTDLISTLNEIFRVYCTKKGGS